MPQVIPGATNLTPPPQQPTPQPPAQQGWGNDNGWGAWNQPASNPGTEKRLTPQERVEMIEKVYMEVLNRKPDTRDINYYKYSTLSEEEIRRQLITGKEHKQLLDEGRDYKKMKDRAMSAETRVAMLESQVKDQVEEFKQLSDLLTEKNQYIQQLREKLNNPYNLSQTTPQPVPTSSEKKAESNVVDSRVIFSQPESVTTKKNNATKSRILEIIKTLLPD
ncbi:hypothetical protein HYV12_02310 [Candidatus Dojkabacteria bacterium]|nr:hypothetical protein [Candidatus Dojkabacteria bacterium]